MENRFLNVSIMQHTITADLDTNLRVIEESVENLMMGYVRPELIVGVEFGIAPCYHGGRGYSIFKQSG